MQPASPLPTENESSTAEGPDGTSATVQKPAGPASQSSDRVLHPPGHWAFRLCHLVRRPDFDGYGFTLHKDEERRPQTVFAVEPGSPAEAAGLHLDDIIVEVNGVNVKGASHQDILDRINSTPNEARLLVATESTASESKESGATISGSLPSVIELSSASTADQLAGSRQAAASSPSTNAKLRAAGLLAELDKRQQIVEYTEPDPSKVNLMLSDSGTSESFLGHKQESDIQADASVRRRAAADGPGTKAGELKTQAKSGPKASAAAMPGEGEASCVHLSPLESLEWMLRVMLVMPLSLPMLVGIVMFLLLALYIFYSYVSREQQA